MAIGQVQPSAKDSSHKNKSNHYALRPHNSKLASRLGWFTFRRSRSLAGNGPVRRNHYSAGLKSGAAIKSGSGNVGLVIGSGKMGLSSLTNTINVTTTTEPLLAKQDMGHYTGRVRVAKARDRTVIFSVLIVVAMLLCHLATVTSWLAEGIRPSSVGPMEAIESHHQKEWSLSKQEIGPTRGGDEFKESLNLAKFDNEALASRSRSIGRNNTRRGQELQPKTVPRTIIGEGEWGQLLEATGHGNNLAGRSGSGSDFQRGMINGVSVGALALDFLRLAARQDNQELRSDTETTKRNEVETRRESRRKLNSNMGHLGDARSGRGSNSQRSSIKSHVRKLADTQTPSHSRLVGQTSGQLVRLRRMTNFGRLNGPGGAVHDAGANRLQLARPQRSPIQNSVDIELAGDDNAVSTFATIAPESADSALESHEQDFEKRLKDWNQKYEANRAISDKAYYILLVIYSLFIIIGAVSNSLICLTVILKPKILSPRNIFIVNLAGSDLLLCVFTMPFSFIEISMKMWQMGLIPCKLVAGLQATSIFVSTISITAIALDRYKVIVYPTHQETHGSTRRAALLLASVWFGALLLSLPLFQFRTVRHVIIELPSVAHKYGTTIKSIDYCIEDWPLTHGRGIYSVISMMFQYVLPITIVSVVYAKISDKLQKRLIRRQRLTQLECQQKKQLNLIRRTHTMLISVSLIFGLSWLPLNLLNVIGDFTDLFKGDDQLFRVVFAICHLIGCSSACSNPILYGYLNENFRKEFHQVYTHHVRRLVRLCGRPSSGSPYIQPNASSSANSSSNLEHDANADADDDEDDDDYQDEDSGDEKIDETDDDYSEEETDDDDDDDGDDRESFDGRAHPNVKTTTSRPSNCLSLAPGSSAYISGGGQRCNSALGVVNFRSELLEPATSARHSTSCLHLFPLLAISSYGAGQQPRQAQGSHHQDSGCSNVADNKPDGERKNHTDQADHDEDDNKSNNGHSQATTDNPGTRATRLAPQAQPTSCVLEVADGRAESMASSGGSSVGLKAMAATVSAADEELATRRCSFQTTTSSGRQPLGLTMKFCLCLSGTSSTETLGGHHLQQQQHLAKQNPRELDNSPLNHHQPATRSSDDLCNGRRPSIRVEQLYLVDVAPANGRQTKELVVGGKEVERRRKKRRPKRRQQRRGLSRTGADGSSCECHCHGQDKATSGALRSQPSIKSNISGGQQQSTRGSNRIRLSDGPAVFKRKGANQSVDSEAGGPQPEAGSQKQGRRVWLRFLPAAMGRSVELASTSRQSAGCEQDEETTGNDYLRSRPKLLMSAAGGQRCWSSGRSRSGHASATNSGQPLSRSGSKRDSGRSRGSTDPRRPKQRQEADGSSPTRFLATGRGQLCEHCVKNCSQQAGQDAGAKLRKRPRQQLQPGGQVDSTRGKPEGSRASRRRAMANKHAHGGIEGLEMEPSSSVGQAGRSGAGLGGVGGRKTSQFPGGAYYLSIETARSDRASAVSKEEQSTSVFVLGASDLEESSNGSPSSTLQIKDLAMDSPNETGRPWKSKPLPGVNHNEAVDVNKRPVNDYCGHDINKTCHDKQQLDGAGMQIYSTYCPGVRLEANSNPNNNVDQPDLYQASSISARQLPIECNASLEKNKDDYGDDHVDGISIPTSQRYENDKPMRMRTITTSQYATHRSALNQCDINGNDDHHLASSQRTCTDTKGYEKIRHLSGDQVKRPNQLMVTTSFTAAGSNDAITTESLPTMRTMPGESTTTETPKKPSLGASGDDDEQQDNQLDKPLSSQAQMGHHGGCTSQSKDFVCLHSNLSASSGSSASCTCNSLSSSTASSSCHLNSASNQTTNSIRSPTICSSLTSLAGSILHPSDTRPEATCGCLLFHENYE